MQSKLYKFFTFYSKNINLFLLLAIAGGGLCGFFFPSFSHKTSGAGELFLRLLTMLIVPIIVLSIISGVINVKDSARLGEIGVKTVVYYFFTTALAVVVGLFLVNLIKPGKDYPSSKTAKSSVVSSYGLNSSQHTHSVKDIFFRMVPKNIVKAALEGNVLGLIFFSALIGIGLLKSTTENQLSTTRSVINSLFSSTVWIVELVMLYAPLGVFGLVASLTSKAVLEGSFYQLSSALGWYFFTVVLGLFIHGFFTLSFFLVFFKINPFKFFKAMFPALVTAFSTASSSATLPVTLESLEERAKVSKEVSGFVAPLGSTVNMDGTAIYEAVAAIFIANVYGMHLGFQEQIIVFLTATFSAVGAASIPGAGLVMMTMVLSSVGIPLEGIKLIVVVDRVLDMLRTSVNVWGDSVGSAVIDKALKKTKKKNG
ncbi:MAG: dicarboxylate/amino acid:cation symporter [Candidatus Dadabacteria bacterium]|nr:MAG: dicarboxylate/amino acid:cation symporter [Candidatus Dadabacteria bacterium]